MISTKELGNRILLARRDLNANQDEIADAAGISRTYISEIERGTTKSVGVAVVFSVAQALGVSPAYLLGLTDDPLHGIDDDEEEPVHLSEARSNYNADPTTKELLELIEGMTPGQRQQMAGIARLLLGGPTIIE